MLGRLRRSLTRESADIIYCSLIRSVLEYCVSVRGCFGERHKERRRISVFKFVKKCCKVNFPNILKNILNVKQPFTPACCVRTEITKRSFYYYECTLTNYLDGISYLFTSKFFICTFFYLHYYQYQCDAYVFHSFSTLLCSGLPLIRDSFLHLKGLP